MNTLTLAVPTYNRKDAIVENTKRLLDSGILEKVNYLVIDNCSEDGTYEELSQMLSACDNAIVLKNEKNIGFFGNILKLFEHCKTDYMLLSSDEDEFVSENIEPFINFLNLNKPSFCSAQIYMNNPDKLYRGRKKVTQIKPNEIRNASNYMSGVVYKVDDSMRDMVAYVEKKYDNEMVHVYPLVVLAVMLASNTTSSFWYDKPLTKKSFSLTSVIEGIGGGKYFSVEARLKQTRDFDALLAELIGSSNDSNQITYLEKVKEKNADFLFSIIRHGLKQEGNPEFLKKFDKNIFHFVIFGSFKRFLSKARTLLRK